MPIPARWTRWPAARTRRLALVCFVGAAVLGLLALLSWPAAIGAAVLTIVALLLNHLAGADRQLSDDEIREIALAARTHPTNDAEIWYAHNDLESERFAGRIAAALEHGQWKALLLDLFPDDVGQPPGRYVVEWETEDVREVAERLAGAFNRIGLRTDLRKQVRGATAGVVVLVRPK